MNYDDLLGKLFEYGARGPDRYDCWGLCLEVGRRAEIIYPEVLSPVKTEDQDDVICRTINQAFEKIENPEPYCIATFSICRPFVDHCGIVLPKDNLLYFLHILKQHRVVRARLDIWKKRLSGFYRLRDAANNDNQSV